MIVVFVSRMGSQKVWGAACKFYAKGLLDLPRPGDLQLVSLHSSPSHSLQGGAAQGKGRDHRVP